MKIVIGVFVAAFFAILVICGGVMSIVKTAGDHAEKIRASKSPEERDADDKAREIEKDVFALKRQTTKILLSQLKAPTTAKIDIEMSHTNGLIAFANGTITSQNAFGAMLTKPVKVTWGRTSTKEAFGMIAVKFEGLDYLDEKLQQKVLATAK